MNDNKQLCILKIYVEVHEVPCDEDRVEVDNEDQEDQEDQVEVDDEDHEDLEVDDEDHEDEQVLQLVPQLVRE